MDLSRRATRLGHLGWAVRFEAWAIAMRHTAQFDARHAELSPTRKAALGISNVPALMKETV